MMVPRCTAEFYHDTKLPYSRTDPEQHYAPHYAPRVSARQAQLEEDLKAAWKQDAPLQYR
jgi:hypothetical protein